MAARAVELHVRGVEREARVAGVFEVRALEGLVRRVTARAVRAAVDRALADVGIGVTVLAARAARAAEQKQ